MPLGTQAVFDPLCGCVAVRCLACLSFKGPTPPVLKFLAALFLTTSIFYNDWYQNGPKFTPQNLSKSQISVILSFKTHSRSRPGKRRRPKGVKPLKMTVVTHFQLFLKKPRASRNARKWKPEWNLWALKIRKIHHMQNSKKQ